MKTIQFKLEIFEGPLDLMLSLISKHKLNIQDIEISILLEQFLNYIEKAGENDIELAGEFLETAARLIFIKTVSLLPKHEAQKLKRELEGTLIEYALCKAAAARLRELNVGALIFTRNPLEIEMDLSYTLPHSILEIIEAFGAVNDRDKLRQIINSTPPPIPTQAAQMNHVSIFTKIVYVLKKIRKGGRLEIRQLFSGDLGRSEQVAIFLALLELSSHGRIAFCENLDYIEFAGKN
jgi:segregation and condensation protein A